MLSQWWVKKYRLPSNHNLFLDRTVEDLLTEFWMDIYIENPLEAQRQADGEIQLTDTGDPYIDKWEEEMAQGLTPDLTEMFTPAQLERYKNLRTKTQGSVRNIELQEAADAAAANTPLERNIRARQEALARKLSPDRFPNQTFGDD